MASTADEYLIEGEWKVPGDALDQKRSSAKKVVKKKWRCRLNMRWCRLNMIVKPTLEEDDQVVGLDSN